MDRKQNSGGTSKTRGRLIVGTFFFVLLAFVFYGIWCFPELTSRGLFATLIILALVLVFVNSLNLRNRELGTQFLNNDNEDVRFLALELRSSDFWVYGVAGAAGLVLMGVMWMLYEMPQSPERLFLILALVSTVGLAIALVIFVRDGQQEQNRLASKKKL